MTLHINDDGTPRTIDRLSVNDDGTIRNVARAFVNDNGTVREIFDYARVPVQDISFLGTRSNIRTGISPANEIYQISVSNNFNSGPLVSNDFSAANIVSSSFAFNNLGTVTYSAGSVTGLFNFPTSNTIANGSGWTYSRPNTSTMRFTNNTGSSVAITPTFFAGIAFNLGTNDITGGTVQIRASLVYSSGGGSQLTQTINSSTPDGTAVLNNVFQEDTSATIPNGGYIQLSVFAISNNANSAITLNIETFSARITGHTLSGQYNYFPVRLSTSYELVLDNTAASLDTGNLTVSTRDNDRFLGANTWDWRNGNDNLISINPTAWSDLVNNSFVIDPLTVTPETQLTRVLGATGNLTITQGANTAVMVVTVSTFGSDFALNIQSITSSSGVPPTSGALTWRFQKGATGPFQTNVTGVLTENLNASQALTLMLNQIREVYPAISLSNLYVSGGNTILEIDLGQQSNLAGTLTVTTNNGSNAIFSLNSAFSDGIAPGGLTSVSSSYTVLDPSGAQSVAFSSFVTAVGESDLSSIISQIITGINSMTETPVNYTAAAEGLITVRATGTTSANVTNTWNVIINHGSPSSGAGNISSVTEIVNAGRGYTDFI